MKKALLTLACIFLSNLLFGQSQFEYKYNYEISFDVTQFADKEPKNTVRNFVDYIFEKQNQKFNVQTRYSKRGIIYISSNFSIKESTVEGFFQKEESEILSFEQNPQHIRGTQNTSSIVQY